MPESVHTMLLISDFNLDVFAGYLTNDSTVPAVKATSAPFGQVMPLLLNDAHECWQDAYESIIVWTRPEQALPSFHSVLNYEHVELDTLMREVDEYVRGLKQLKNRTDIVFIPTWTVPVYVREYGMLSMKHGLGVENILLHINGRLAEKLNDEPNMYVLNANRWLRYAGKKASNPKLWYMAKIMFGNDVFKEAVRDCKAALRAITGGMKKMIIVDLDDTLWGGIVGEVGWKDLVLGGHDPLGEAYVDLQCALKALKNRGVVLGVVSKNEEQNALEAIDERPEMVLKREDFVGWRINWNDKAANIVDLVNEVNVGLQSVVFLDDSPVERARVKEILPEVLVPALPEDKMLYAQTLRELDCFDTPFLSAEDRQRSELYTVEQKRQAAKSAVGSLDEWLSTLQLCVCVEALNEANLPRVAQLLNKTNQMNLTTRRMSEKELMTWAQEKNNALWAIRVSDRFGDAGLTGIMSISHDGAAGMVADFVLSCRVIGRRIEETITALLVQAARARGVATLTARYMPTEKNKPCLVFWQRSGFMRDKTDTVFTWDVADDYPFPKAVTIQGNL